MSMKLDQKATPGADKDPFAQLSLHIERNIRKKKAVNDDDRAQEHPETLKQQGREVAEPAQSKASAAAAAVLMSHWSEQKAPTAAPIDTLTTADRQRLRDKRKVTTANEPAKGDKADPAAKADEPSKNQSHE